MKEFKITTINAVGLIVLILLVVDLFVGFIAKADRIGYKIRIFILSSASALSIYQFVMLMQINAGLTVWVTFSVIMIILISLIQKIVYLAEKE